MFPTRLPEAGELLIKVAAAGICGSDMHAYLGHDERRPAPLILGHEVSGTIMDAPADAGRIVVNPLVTCGSCEACLGGSYQPLPRTRNHFHAAPRGSVRRTVADA